MDKSRAIAASHVMLAIVLAVVLMIVGAAAAERFQLPFIHGWALAHGTVFVMFPVYYLASYYSVRPLVGRLHSRVAGIGFLIPFVAALLGLLSDTMHGTGVDEMLGHKDVSTTMIYTHVLNRGGQGIRSPADGLTGLNP